MNKKFCNNSTLLQNNLDFHLVVGAMVQYKII